jgi:hypothetical protein
VILLGAQQYHQESPSSTNTPAVSLLFLSHSNARDHRPLGLQGITAEKTQINTPPPYRYVRGKFDVLSSSSETAMAPEARGSAYINNYDAWGSLVILGVRFLLTLFLSSQTIGRRTPPASIHDGESDGFFRFNVHSLRDPLVIRFVRQVPSEAPDLDVSSDSECDLETVPLACTWAPSERLATTTQPSVNVGQSRNRCVNSRIVGRGVCLVPDVN